MEEREEESRGIEMAFPYFPEEPQGTEYIYSADQRF